MTEKARRAARLQARVHGAVQGVGYRFFARREALALDLVGYVRNLPDGTVEVGAEGALADLEAYLQRLQRGPSEAEVQWIDSSWTEAKGVFTEFQIRS
jgi:acylphosphatase